MSYITNRYNASGTIIVEGCKLFLDDANPLNVNNSAGILRANQAFKQFDGAATAFTAAAASTEKVAILQMNTSTGVVSKKDGSSVPISGNNDFVFLKANENSGGIQGQYHGNSILNSSGSAMQVTEVRAWMNQTNGSGTFTAYYQVSNSATPTGAPAADWTSLGGKATGTVNPDASPYGFLGEWTGLTVNLPNGYYFHVVFYHSASSCSMKKVDFNDGAQTIPAGFTIPQHIRYASSSWTVTTAADRDLMGQQDSRYAGSTTAYRIATSYSPPVEPSPDSGNVKLCSVGSGSYPITATFDTIVTGTPADATEAKFVDVTDTMRL